MIDNKNKHLETSNKNFILQVTISLRKSSKCLQDNIFTLDALLGRDMSFSYLVLFLLDIEFYLTEYEMDVINTFASERLKF